MIAMPDGRFRAIRLGRRKMPDPITIPTTIRVASSGPSLRGRCSILFQRYRMLLDEIVHTRAGAADDCRDRPHVVKGLRVLDSILLPQRAVPGEDELFYVVPIRRTVVV